MSTRVVVRSAIVVAMVAALVTVGVGGLAVGSTFAAARGRTTAASGTAACTMRKGKLAISPPLSFTGTAASATFTFTADLGCTGTSGVTGGTLSATGTSASNNCTPLASTGLPALTATVKWKGKHKFVPSTIGFSDGNFAIGNQVTITVPSTGPSPAAGTSTISGSFAYEPAQATFISDQPIDAFLSGCSSTTRGLTGFTFTGVNGASTLDISQQQVVPPPPPPPSTPVTLSVDASSPGAPVDQNLIGVNHIVAGSAAALQAIGATWGRTDAALEFGAGTPQAAYNCTTGAFDPSYLDGNVALDQAAGVQTELIVDYLPPCIADRSSSASRAKWKNLVYEMALHEITAEGVRVFEVFNEPNFHGLGLDGAGGYLVLYRDTALALEKAASAAHLSIEVGGPAVDELGQIDNSWISALAAYAVANKLPLDFLSWHQYPNDPDEGPQSFLPNGLCVTGTPLGGQPCWYNPDLDITLYHRGAAAIRSILSAYPSLHPLLWVDEWGIDSGDDARLDGPYAAAFVAAALGDAQQGGIDRMSFYDTADNPSDPAYDNFGVLYGNLTPKPVYSAFSYWHQLSGSLLPVALSPDQSASAPVGQIGAVASAGSGGTVRVMVYNFAPYDASGAYGATDPTPFDHQVTLDLSNLAAGSYTVNQSLVDGGHDGAIVATSSASGSSASLTFTLAGEGVTLFVLTPSS